VNSNKPVGTQALERNASDTERWQAYKEENETAIRNLETFSRSLTVEVMVPLGKKAMMPGELIHTNEVLVGHYEGYFSQCSSHKAQEICRHRLKIAAEQLKNLQAEADLWQNNLNTPLEEGALPSGDQVEIVEDFNEEAHNQWLTEHRESVRRQKEQERLQRKSEASEGGDNVLRKLEEREMMEELGLDPQNVNEGALEDLLNTQPTTSGATPLSEEQESLVWKKLEAQEESEETETLATTAEESLKSTDDLVRKLMAGDMPASSSKKRIGREKNPTEKKEETRKALLTPELLNSLDSDEEDQEEEVQTIRKQMSLMPVEERVPFLKTQLQLLRTKMCRIQKVTFISEELVHLMNVVVMLEDDLQDMLCDLAEVSGDEEEGLAEPITEPKTRRISFAAAEEKLEFRREETVAEMLSNARKNSRDVIKLDDEKSIPITMEHPKKAERKPALEILEKVQRNIDFVKENQSVQDFDLLNQILGESTGLIKTLHISFKHSDAVPDAKVESEDNTPGTPADFYEKYKRDLSQATQSLPIYVNGFAGEEEVKVPIMSEAARESAYEDPRSQFSKPGKADSECNDLEAPTKSILRNKSAVEQEPHIVNQRNKKGGGKKNRKSKKKERTLDDDLRDMSAYTKVMHDLVEKPVEEAAEPLPQGKFIDTHAPKKRVSRFKEQRSRSKT
ncbi:hypothetical protein KR018_009569, partial [Drosophila ironensis]